MRIRTQKLVLIALFGVLLVACDSLPLDPDRTLRPGTTEPAPGTTEAPVTTEAPGTTESPDTTQAPTTTEAPATTEPSGSDDDGFEIDPSLLWVVLGVTVALLILGWAMGRRGRKTAQAPVAPVVGWKDHLRDGFGQARWLSDGLTEELAIWRGNAMATGDNADIGTELSSRWAQLDQRYDSARDSLYRAEASAPDSASSTAIRRVLEALSVARTAIDSRAEARRLASAAGGDVSAAERERIASSNLDAARAELNNALTGLSGLI